MKDEIEVNDLINQNQIIEIEDDKEENKKKEKINDEDENFLYNFIIDKNKDIFDEKKTKIKLKACFIFLIKYINKLNDEEFFPFFHYLDNIGISILKVLINRYIEHEIDEEQEVDLYKIINKLISFNMNKNTFDFIYKKLSHLYRKHETIKTSVFIRRFEKLFKIWKSFYSVENSCVNFKNNNNSNFVFFNKLNKRSKNIVINFGENLQYDDTATLQYYVTINFISSTILDLNKFNKENFSFIKIYDNKDSKIKIKYNDIFNENNNIVDSFSKVHTLKFEINFLNIKIFINNVELKKKIEFEYNRIKRIEILNYFIGEISSIEVIRDFIMVSENYKKENLKIDIKNDLDNISDNKFIYKISLTNEENGNKNIKTYNSINDENLVKLEGELFSEKYLNNNRNKVINNNRNKILNNNKIDLNNLKYYGGLNSFIPLFKLINYVILKLKESYKEKEEKEEKEEKDKKGENIDNLENDINNYINKSLNWVKDVLQTIIKMICLSKNNYENFQNIVIPLIGSVAEILHSLKDLESSNIIKHSQISSLFNDEIFFVYFIIILNSTFPNNLKKLFNDLFGIINNFQNYKFTMNQIMLDINNIKNLDWYFSFLFNFIIFILIYFDSIDIIPKSLVDHLNQIYLYKKKEMEKKEKNKDDINILKVMEPFLNFINCLKNNSKGLEDAIKKFPDYFILLNTNNYYIYYVAFLIKAFICANRASINMPINLNPKKNYNDQIQKLISNYIFDRSQSSSKGVNYLLVINDFKYFIDDFKFLRNLFNFLKEDYFFTKEELIMNELIDYHGQYHHLMKELFIFNRPWSKKKIFFKNTLNEIKGSGLKFKNINYYTKNFQRPVIYPTLDYKKQYPEFSKFKISKDNKLYNYEETDDYNFELICDELDKLIETYDEELIEEKKKNGTINIFTNVCLVKQTYHVRGILLIINNKVLYFYSSSYNKSNARTCNKLKDNLNNKNKGKNNDLCYGSIFKCPKKEINRKIRIDFKSIRLLMKRIYYYRSTAIEIFTETKSYYFNFDDLQKSHNFFILFVFPFLTSHFKININGELFGYKKKNKKGIKHYDDKKETDFFELFSNQVSNKEVCIFDIIILINLISNRSFNDLYQYPVFPLLYYYDKDNNYNKIPRILNRHIGFQDGTRGAKARLKLFNDSFKKNQEDDDLEDTNEIPNYFYTHYSNIVYTCNYLIRLFPFSFGAIELQGDGFDDPNRLFFSIQSTFYNISIQKSDIRELIPEFFYLPEMFMNINNIKFGKVAEERTIDDVIMPKELQGKINSDINKNNNIIILSDNDDNINKLEQIFIFVERNKNNLEALKDNINSWINIIFGTKQRYNNKREQYFRTESYIDNEDCNKEYLKDDIIMSSVDFGLIPLQIFNKNSLFKLKKTNYEKLDEEIKKQIKTKVKIRTKSLFHKKNNKKENKNKNKMEKRKSHDFNINEIKSNNIHINETKDYWEDELDIEINHINDGNIGKLEISENNDLINEIIDHNNIIIDSFYNKRLNMFASTSYDGFICVYILPKKLISMIKHPNNSYYDNVFLSSNPFPSIIAFDKKENILTSYSLSGIMIKSVKVESKNNLSYKINHVFNLLGGTFKDRIYLYLDSGECKILNAPFFDMVKEDQLKV